ncbi:acyl carrier protein [Capnocytophaga sp. oral taxon 903]|uniref:acyl carrier protein n=1 Tax=Capnocytophaga sp. oral taxon 903 TaxID=2748317 RepID=UPI0015BA90CD|nr:acyl carrier protein [Capnocytophaga sp. oral taxon 903]NWO28813.1 acyl carrier protein [Capnocytophaga sp. oral taxon 903]
MNISIHKYLPHRPPMQMVDTITDISNTHVVTEFEVKSTCIFVEEGKFAEVGLIENMAQTCSAIVGQFLFGIEDTSNYVIGYISAIKRLELFALPKVQEVVRTEAELLSRFDTDEYYICSMRCNAFVGDILMATAEMNLVIKNLTE